MPSTLGPRPSTRSAFTLVEMLVTLALLSLIVLSLMTVFNSTQKAFRASLTQTDILESGRLAMGLIADDLAKTTPSFGTNSLGKGSPTGGPDPRVSTPVNFFVDANPYTVNYQPFVQYLPGTSAQRTNVLETFFMLSRQNINGSPSWVGTGYVVDPSSRPTNSLYRFFQFTNVMKGNPGTLYTNFASIANNQLSYLYNPFTNTTLWTHVM
ncbi:MAG: PilW family protein, partial [Limisphaerales bacterium]